MKTPDLKIPIPLESQAGWDLAERFTRLARNSSAPETDREFLDEQAAAFRLYAEDRRIWERSGANHRSAGNPLVSVILPVRNRETLLVRAIRSVQSQGYQNWECLVVDDGSSDGSAEVARCLAVEDPRIRVFEQPHRGAASARNRGLAEARGSLVAYLDSDNRYLPDFLAPVVDAFERGGSEVRCLYAAMVTVDAESGESLLYREVQAERRLERNVTDLNVFAHRRDTCEQLGGFDEELRRLQDWDLILRYTNDSPPLRLPVVGVEYSVMAKDRISRRESIGLAYTRLLRKHRPALAGRSNPGSAPPAILCVHRVGSTWPVHDAPAAAESGFRLRSVEWASGGADALEEVRHDFRPDVIHLQGEACLRDLADLVKTWRIPVTARIDEVASPVSGSTTSWPNLDAIRRLELPPDLPVPPEFPDHLASVYRPGINPDLFAPDWNANEEKRWVITTAEEAIDARFLRHFFDLAEGCRTHSFAILFSAGSFLHHTILEETRERLAATPEATVELLTDLDATQRAHWMRRASLYLTGSRESSTPSRCTVRMVEAMACGCLPLIDAHLSRSMFPRPGPLVGDSPESFAEEIAATLSWTPDEWRNRALNCLDVVFPYLTAMESSRDLFRTWNDLATIPLRP